MTKEEFKQFEKKLNENGYVNYHSSYKDADYSYFKSFGKNENKYDEERSLYQICFSIYDFSKYSRIDKHLLENPIAIQPTIKISRVISERIDLDLISDEVEETDIVKIEKIASNLYKWAEENIIINTNKLNQQV